MSTLLFNPFHAPYMQRALIMLVLLSVMGAVCGMHVLFRRLAFLSEALQHTVFPGIAVAFLWNQSLLLGAITAAVLTVVLFTFLARRPDIDQDATLALLISTFFAVGVVVVSRSGSYQHDLTQLLFGRILTIDRTQVIETAVIAVVVVVALTLAHKELVMRAFDPDGARAMGYRVAAIDLLLNVIVAVVVVAAVQAVGTVLLVAFLLTPAAAGRLVFQRIGVMMLAGAALGAVVSWFGLGLSFYLSTTKDVTVASGATVVLCATVVFLVVAGITALIRSARRRAAPGAPVAAGAPS